MPNKTLEEKPQWEIKARLAFNKSATEDGWIEFIRSQIQQAQERVLEEVGKFSDQDDSSIYIIITINDWIKLKQKYKNL